MENAFFRYKVDHRGEPSSAQSGGQETEAILACNILNQMTQLGSRRRTLSVGNGSVGRGRCGSVSNRATTPVFTWVLQRLADAHLVEGHTIGIDATTLEANAAMRSIVRRDTGEAYEAW